MSRSKVYGDAASALDGLLFDGMTLMSGGFGLSGNPEHLIPAVRASGVKDLTVISNNCGADGLGLWVLLDSGQIAGMVSSYVGENKLFAELYLSGRLKLELNPQARSARAGPAFRRSTPRPAWARSWRRASRPRYSRAKPTCAKPGSARTWPS